MKAFFLVAAAITSSTPVFAQKQSPEPKSLQGKCAKEAGGYWDGKKWDIRGGPAGDRYRQCLSRNSKR